MGKQFESVPEGLSMKEKLREPNGEAGHQPPSKLDCGGDSRTLPEMGFEDHLERNQPILLWQKSGSPCTIQRQQPLSKQPTLTTYFRTTHFT